MLAAFVGVPWTIPELLQELLKLPPTGQALRMHLQNGLLPLSQEGH
jgi:hypothetical protein